MRDKQASTEYGFTLVESVISLGIFMLVTISIINLTAFASRVVERVSIRAELLENARIAIDMMNVYIKSAESIEIFTDPDGLGLSRIRLMVSVGSGLEPREFKYNSLLSPGDDKYHRLEFGNNELASYIARVTVALDDDILTINLRTDDRLSLSGRIVAPIELTLKIRVYNPIKLN